MAWAAEFYAGARLDSVWLDGIPISKDEARFERENTMRILKATRWTMMAGLAAGLLVFGYPAGKAVAAAPKAPAGAMMFGYQGSDLDFDLVNRTGYQIKAVLVSPSREADWSYNNDVIKGRRFDDNTKLHIHFNHHAQAHHWDLKVVYDNNVSGEWDDLKLDDISKVTLWFDLKTNMSRAEIE
jgi:hypothetical protein